MVRHGLVAHRGSETEFELATIERLEGLGYGYVHGIELDRPLQEVILRDRLRAFLAQQYPGLPGDVIDEALQRFSTPEGVDTLRRNMAFHEALTRGIEVRVERPGEAVYGVEFMRDLIHEVVQVIKRTVKVTGPNPTATTSRPRSGLRCGACCDRVMSTPTTSSRS